MTATTRRTAQDCHWYWGSHGCGLLQGHRGDHVCPDPDDVEDPVCDSRPRGHPDLFHMAPLRSPSRTRFRPGPDVVKFGIYSPATMDAAGRITPGPSFEMRGPSWVPSGPPPLSVNYAEYARRRRARGR